MPCDSYEAWPIDEAASILKARTAVKGRRSGAQITRNHRRRSGNIWPITQHHAWCGIEKTPARLKPLLSADQHRRIENSPEARRAIIGKAKHRSARRLLFNADINNEAHNDDKIDKLGISVYQ